MTGIWYLPSSQRPRSTSLQRSLQNGNAPSGSPAAGSRTGFLQMGQRKAMTPLRPDLRCRGTDGHAPRGTAALRSARAGRRPILPPFDHFFFAFAESDLGAGLDSLLAGAALAPLVFDLADASDDPAAASLPAAFVSALPFDDASDDVPADEPSAFALSL